MGPVQNSWILKLTKLRRIEFLLVLCIMQNGARVHVSVRYVDTRGAVTVVENKDLDPEATVDAAMSQIARWQGWKPPYKLIFNGTLLPTTSTLLASGVVDSSLLVLMQCRPPRNGGARSSTQSASSFAGGDGKSMDLMLWPSGESVDLDDACFPSNVQRSTAPARDGAVIVSKAALLEAVGLGGVAAAEVAG